LNIIEVTTGHDNHPYLEVKILICRLLYRVYNGLVLSFYFVWSHF